jgi:two-component system OmpR family response regulator
MKILLIEDEPQLLSGMKAYLETEGYVITTASTFRQGQEKAHDYDYDCVVVDIGLPDGNGLELIRQLKAKQAQTGIIIVSARDSLNDKLTGLELGSDDYLTKPFHLPELNARIKSVLRRRFFGGQNLIQFAKITINSHTHQVSIEGQPVILTEKEYQILLFFVANPDRFTHQRCHRRILSGETTWI